MNIAPSSITRRHLLAQAAALAACAALPPLTLAAKDKTQTPGEDLFAKPTLLNLTFTASEHALASLRKDPRNWVESTVTVDSQEFPLVAIHLKSTTSFLPVDKKPSFTLNFKKQASGRRFHGLRKIHLNNSIQDSSYLCEDLAGELFRRAGVPAARAAWAKVRLNDRDLGLYVLKEGFAPEFLALHFAETKGNFYDGGLHHDLWEPLELDSGNGPQDHSDLKAIYAATQNPDLPARWQQLQKLLDLDRFVSMMAMECLTCHIDGYSLMQNNYRVYFDPASNRAVFIAHGLDRMFEQPEYPLEPPMRGVVSVAILNTPEGRKLFRQRLADLIEKVFQPDWMLARMDTAVKVLAPAEPLVAPQADALRQRILARAAFAHKKVADLRIKAS